MPYSSTMQAFTHCRHYLLLWVYHLTRFHHSHGSARTSLSCSAWVVSASYWTFLVTIEHRQHMKTDCSKISEWTPATEKTLKPQYMEWFRTLVPCLRRPVGKFNWKWKCTFFFFSGLPLFQTHNVLMVMSFCITVIAWWGLSFNIQIGENLTNMCLKPSERSSHFSALVGCR
jgi:hypothetical protein